MARFRGRFRRFGKRRSMSRRRGSGARRIRIGYRM